jgi:uncharacterized protein (TIGR00255 family)
MIKSMTGFGSCSLTKDTISISVEVKTLNSKFLDLALKMPRIISDKEIEIRNMVTDQLIRGKISFSIQYLTTSDKELKYNINEGLFQTYLDQFKALEAKTDRTFDDILKLALDAPNVIEQTDDSIDIDTWGSIKSVIIAAINDCNNSRHEEGDKLVSVLSGYIDKIMEALGEIKSIEPNRLIKIKEKIKNNISELAGGIEFDSERLEQELIYYSEKLDIHEEIERLSIHLNSYQKTLKTKDNQHGKKLGFISQEIGREINTIGSKANDAVIQQYVILMKEELEKIKEQTLNIL